MSVNDGEFGITTNGGFYSAYPICAPSIYGGFLEEGICLSVRKTEEKVVEGGDAIGCRSSSVLVQHPQVGSLELL